MKHRVVLGTDTDAELFLEGREPEPWDDQDEDATATINYTSGTTARPKGVRAHPPQPLDQRGHLRLAHRASTTATSTSTRCRCSTATAGACPTRSPAMGVPQVVLRKVDGADILRRIDEHGVTLLCGAPGGRRHGPRRRRRPGTARSPGAAAPASSWPAPRRPPGRSSGSRPSSGWEFIQIYGLTETAPLLTINRTRAEWDDLVAGRAGRSGSAGPACPPSGIEVQVDGEGEVLARGNHVLEGYWDQPEATPTPSSAAGSTPATAARSTTAATSRSATARRT